MKILLGSNSPRRNELLRQMGVDFEKVQIHCEENFPESLEATDVAEYLSVKKAKAYTELKEDEVLITADTTVVLGQQILNKPINREAARIMLSTLSGRQHRVITGVCLARGKDFKSFNVITRVTVANLTERDIDYYIENYKPYDKAGSYGIQEWFGLTQISSIEGCFYNVVGLPCYELNKRLKELNV